MKSREREMQGDEKLTCLNTHLTLGLQATNVNVAIRLRPPLKENSSQSSFVVSPNQRDILDTSRGVTYTLDAIFDQTNSTKDVFDSVVKPIVDSCVEGFNGTVLAYGQTSSGKTHTMQGDPTVKQEGIISYSLKEIFNQIHSTTLINFSITLTYVEVYNETLIDLIGPTLHGNHVKNWQDENSGILSVQDKMSTFSCQRKRLPQVTIVEGNDGFLELKGATVFKAKSFDETVTFLESCDKSRHVSDTHLNERSSRSHTILTLRIESNIQSTPHLHSPNDMQKENCGFTLRVGLLNLVDLAGSEGVSRSKTEGLKRLEGSKINRSLLALTRVISQIVQRQQRSEKEDIAPSHITYRDSKLTRLLSNSLGGNSKTLIICCCSPELCDARESISTLEFASRAKCIRNKAKVNLIETLPTSTGRIHEENLRLREEVLQLRAGLVTEKIKIRSNGDVDSPHTSFDVLSRRKRLPPSSSGSLLGMSEKKKASICLKKSPKLECSVGSVISPRQVKGNVFSCESTPRLHDLTRTGCVTLLEGLNKMCLPSTFCHSQSCVTRSSVLCLAEILTTQPHQSVDGTQEKDNFIQCEKDLNSTVKHWTVVRHVEKVFLGTNQTLRWCEDCQNYESAHTPCITQLLKEKHEKERQLLARTLEQKYVTEICTLREELIEMKRQNHAQLLKQKKEWEATFEDWKTKKLQQIEESHALKTTLRLNEIKKEYEAKIEAIQKDVVRQEKQVRETLEKECLLKLDQEQETFKKTLETLYEENLRKTKQEAEEKLVALQSSYELNLQENKKRDQGQFWKLQQEQLLEYEENLKKCKDNLVAKLREAQEKTDMFEQSAYTLQKQLEDNQRDYEMKLLKSTKLIESLQGTLSQNGFLLEDNLFLQKKIDTLTYQIDQMSSHVQTLESQKEKCVQEFQTYCGQLEREKALYESHVEETLQKDYEEKMNEFQKSVTVKSQSLKTLEEKIIQQQVQINGLLQTLQECQQKVQCSEKQHTQLTENYLSLQEQLAQLEKEKSTFEENSATCQDSLNYWKQAEKQSREYWTKLLQQKCTWIDQCLTGNLENLTNHQASEQSLLLEWEASLQDNFSVTSLMCVFSMDIFSSYVTLLEISLNDLENQIEQHSTLQESIHLSDMIYATPSVHPVTEAIFKDLDGTSVPFELCLSLVNRIDYQQDLFYFTFDITHTITAYWKETLQKSEQRVEQYSEDLQKETQQLFAVRQELEVYRQEEKERQKQQDKTLQKLVHKIQQITPQNTLHASTDTLDLSAVFNATRENMETVKNNEEQALHLMHDKQTRMLEDIKLSYEERLSATESLVTAYKRNVQDLTEKLDALYKDYDALRKEQSKHWKEMDDSRHTIEQLENEILYWKTKENDSLQAQTVNHCNSQTTKPSPSQTAHKIRSVLKSTQSTPHFK
ncbi:uncharacterized protein LOC128883143 isoform X2 [Hylaeus volcanicus]|uniref:uncharacterized protein LOC128883143 isoform X2 n=1 Tax=Hylaeus volcanicus TaxID=313075 RepID=UPI0023B86217|nr:uncharacterized protein LOC128883143 isoform X2 [Hylaeus volcanicus]